MSVDADPYDPIAQTVLDLLAAAGPGASLSPEDVARSFADSRRKPGDPPDLWRRYLMAVKQQSLFLARRGEIEIVRKGQVVDPQTVKGVYRLRRTV